MDQPFHKTLKFKKLQETWYAKLKKKGFEDIEHDEDHLKNFALNGTRNVQSRISPAVVAARLSYYSMARGFLCTYGFKSKLEKAIFERHAEGVGIRKIAAELTTKRRPLNKRKVHETIQRFVKVMKEQK
jgi:hypothetical protein